VQDIYILTFDNVTRFFFLLYLSLQKSKKKKTNKGSKKKKGKEKGEGIMKNLRNATVIYIPLLEVRFTSFFFILLQSNHVLSGPVLSNHPLLRDQVKKRPKSPLNYCNLSSIKWSRSPFPRSQRVIFIVFTCIKETLY